MYTNWTWTFRIAGCAPSAVATALGMYGIDAASISLVKGLWKGETNLATVIEIVAPLNGQEDMLALAEYLRNKFDQDSVLVTKHETHHLLVEARD